MRWLRSFPGRSVLVVLLLVPGWTGQTRLPLLSPPVRIAVTPVTLCPGKISCKRVGPLVFDRGYQLRSGDPAFGGFSALLVDGDVFTLLSDGGNIVRLRIDSAGRLRAARIGELPGGPGTGWRKNDRDSESMTRDPATGQIWVGFEQHNAIWRYAAGLGRALRHAEPAAMADWPTNGGPEAMARLRDGRFVVLSEQARPVGQDKETGRDRIGLVFTRDPTIAPRRGFRFVYRPPDGFSPSDMAELPDGRLIVLNRRFRLPGGFDVVVTIIDRRDIAPRRRVSGRPIAHFQAPLLHDNFEGIAIVPDARGVGLWILSDDNQSVFQQSLLLKFHIADAAPRPPRR